MYVQHVFAVSSQLTLLRIVHAGHVNLHRVLPKIKHA